MNPEFSGVERRLERLKECLLNLEPLKEEELDTFLGDPNLRAIAERNLEVAAQCCIDICNRIISIEQFEKPRDSFEAIMRMGEMGVMPLAFAQQFAPLSGFRNILVHSYLEIDWKEVYANMQNTSSLYEFIGYVKNWMKRRSP